MSTINWNLKSALVKRFGSQVEAAHRLGIRESRLSRIVRGYEAPKKSERLALAESLGETLLLDEKMNKGGME
jgi:hypothetical protein